MKFSKYHMYLMIRNSSRSPQYRLYLCTIYGAKAACSSFAVFHLILFWLIAPQHTERFKWGEGGDGEGVVCMEWHFHILYVFIYIQYIKSQSQNEGVSTYKEIAGRPTTTGVESIAGWLYQWNIIFMGFIEVFPDIYSYIYI